MAREPSGGRPGRLQGAAIGVVALAIASVGVIACSLAISADTPQCTSDADCTARGAAFAGATCVDRLCAATDAGGVKEGGAGDAGPDVPTQWSCIGTSGPAVPSGPTVLHLRLVDGATVSLGADPLSALERATGVSEVKVAACGALDVDCAQPFDVGGSTSLTADAEGNVVIPLPAGFAGYIEARSPAFLRLLLFFSGPVEDMDGGWTFAMVKRESLPLLASLAGASVTDQSSLVSYGAFDCAHLLAAGVSFTADTLADASVPFYIVDGLPSTTIAETTVSGAAGIMNAASGVYAVRANVAATNQLIGEKRIAVRPGNHTHLAVVAR